MSSLASTTDIVRPLLSYSKAEIVEYAQLQRLQWREDSTNRDESYSRNYIRHNFVGRFSQADRAVLLNLLDQAALRNQAIDQSLSQLSVDRTGFRLLPHAVARELMAYWLRQKAVPDIDGKMLERLVRGAKLASDGTQIDARAGWYLRVSRKDLALQRTER